MKMQDLVNSYIEYRDSLGESCTIQLKYLLKQFSREMGTNINVKDVTTEMVLVFLVGKKGMITNSWFSKRTVIRGLFNYAKLKRYIFEIPLPDFSPQKPAKYIPYIYSNKELKSLFDSALTYQKGPSQVDPVMIRTILILTYTMALRRREVLLIKLKDIDLAKKTILIEQSKFYKTRYVTFNQQIKDIIIHYLLHRKEKCITQDSGSYLFVWKGNKPFGGSLLDAIFSKIRLEAGIKRTDGAVYQPRIYDLRHTFATNRLISWYEEGKDVQILLPVLSTFLGHHRLDYTSVYLSMTNKLLEEANKKFNHYANENRL